MRKGWDACSVWRRLRRDLISPSKYLMSSSWACGAGLFLAVYGDRKGAVGTNRNTISSIWTWGKTGERLWSLLLRSCSIPIWMLSWAVDCREPTLAEGWTRWTPEVSSNTCNTVLLWNCNLVYSICNSVTFFQYWFCRLFCTLCFEFGF